MVGGKLIFMIYHKGKTIRGKKMNPISKPSWPEFSYDEFKSTGYLLHRILQGIGKLKLITPFEYHWGNVALWVTGRGLTTGAIPFKSGTFNIEIDFIAQQILCTSSWGQFEGYSLQSNSVAEQIELLFKALAGLGIDLKINSMPQEVPDPIAFEKDTEQRVYQPALAFDWWQIVKSTHQVLKRYHSKFKGISPPVGLMWGTMDLRDARYQGTSVPVKPGSNIIDRNAWDDVQIEAGWWAGSEIYPKPAFFSLAFPQPAGIENNKIQPDQAGWHDELNEFLLDYADLRQSKNPDEDLLKFFDSSYQAAADLMGWDPKLIGTGNPV